MAEQILQPNRETTRKKNVFDLLKERELGISKKLDISNQIKLFQQCKMTVHDPKIEKEKEEEDYDITAQSLRNKALEKIIFPGRANPELFAKVYSMSKKLIIDGVSMQLIFFYSMNRWNMRGVSVLQSHNFKGYASMTLDLMSRMQAFVPKIEQEEIEIVLIQETEAVYSQCGLVDCKFLFPNNVTTIILPTGLSQNFKIFQFMHHIIDDYAFHHEIKNLAEIRTFWHYATGMSAGGLIPETLIRNILEFEGTLQSSTLEYFTEYDYLKTKSV